MSDSLKTKALVALFWKLFERVGYQLSLLIIQVILARLLDPSSFGSLAVIVAIINLSTCIVQGGMNTSLVRSSDAKEVDYSTVFWLSMFVASILFVIIYIAAPHISSFYQNDELIWPLRAMGILLFINSFNSIQVAISVKELNLKIVFFSTILSVVVAGILSITAAYAGLGLWSLVFQQLVYQICSCLAMSLQVKWVPKPVFSLSRARFHFCFGIKMLISSLANMGYQDIFDLIVGGKFNTHMLGYYNQGKKFPRVVSKLFESSVQPVMISAVAQLKDDRKRVVSALRKSITLSTFLLTGVLAWMASSSDAIVAVVLTEKWLPSASIMQLTCLAYACWPILTCNIQALNALGKSDVTLIIALIKCGLGIPLLVVFTSIYNTLEAAAIAFILTNAIAAVMTSIATCRIFDYSFRSQLVDILPIWIIGLISYLLTIILLAYMAVGYTVQLIVGFLIAFISYFGIALIMKADVLKTLYSTIKDIRDIRP